MLEAQLEVGKVGWSSYSESMTEWIRNNRIRSRIVGLHFCGSLIHPNPVRKMTMSGNQTWQWKISQSMALVS